MPSFAIIRQILGWFWPVAAFQFVGANRKLDKQLENYKDNEAFVDIRALSFEQMQDYLEKEQARLKIINDKLTKLTLALSVAVTVGMTFSGTIVTKTTCPAMLRIVVVGLCVAMFMLLAGALIGLKGLETQGIRGYGAAFMALCAQGESKAREEMEKALCWFQVQNTKQSNRIWASLSLVRSGILWFFSIITAVSIMRLV